MPKNIDQVFEIFRKEYQLVPLEVFGDDKYKTLISTILSSRTNDDTTLKASKRLFKEAPDIHSLVDLNEKQIEKLIYPVGFYKTKAKYLKKCAKQILHDHHGKIPSSRKELMELPGVGRKTANLVLNRAFGKPAIAVDTHVHKISNMLGWVDTDKPEQTEVELTKIIPERYWSDMNRLFVSIGRKYTSKSKVKKFLSKEGLI